MKVRFYCDVYSALVDPKDLHLTALTTPYQREPSQGCTRVAFDVEFPDDIMRPYDVQAPDTAAQVVE